MSDAPDVRFVVESVTISDVPYNVDPSLNALDWPPERPAYDHTFYSVLDNESGEIIWVDSEWMANVCAWALNRVAKGQTIAVVSHKRDDKLGVSIDTVIDEYSGPTPGHLS